MQVAHNETYGCELLARRVERDAGEVEGLNAKPLTPKRGTEEWTRNAAYWAGVERQQRMEARS